jgi:phosphoglycolate phosphatase
MKAVFFDLDGTLTDPRAGIVGCIRYAFEQLGVALPAGDDLTWCIGPPLQDSLGELLRGRASADEALQLYRKRFASVGLYENTLYDGVADMLALLKARRHRLYLATSKPHVYAARILKHFALDGYFDGVFGAELDGTRADKSALLAHALARSKEAPGASVMIGDRRHDIAGALANGMACIGVVYGYGGRDELRAAGAQRIIETPRQIAEILASPLFQDRL